MVKKVLHINPKDRGVHSALELRITGPADADPDQLREIADSGKRILEESGMAKHIRLDMRQRVRKLVPVVDQARSRVVGELDVVPVRPAFSINSLPLSEVTRGVEVEWEDPIIPRWNRRREIALQAQPDGVTFPTLLAGVSNQLEAMPLPTGYRLFWVWRLCFRMFSGSPWPRQSCLDWPLGPS